MYSNLVLSVLNTGPNAFSALSASVICFGSRPDYSMFPYNINFSKLVLHSLYRLSRVSDPFSDSLRLGTRARYINVDWSVERRSS